MSRRVAQGATVLAMTLATVGAFAGTRSSDRAEAGQPTGSRGSLQAAPVSTSVVTVPDVPLRSGRPDSVAPETAPEPVAVRIGGVGLDAPVVPVGVDDADQLDVPAADTVGWYRYSAPPGAAGATVLAAHVDYGGAPGAFFLLGQVAPGDTVELELEGGKVLLFDVIGNTEYDKSELPADEVFRKSGDPVLQLITCGGRFDPDARSYRANVVVTAVPRSG
jgi:hypothetical protein